MSFFMNNTTIVQRQLKAHKVQYTYINALKEKVLFNRCDPDI